MRQCLLSPIARTDTRRSGSRAPLEYMKGIWNSSASRTAGHAWRGLPENLVFRGGEPRA